MIVVKLVSFSFSPVIICVLTSFIRIIWPKMALRDNRNKHLIVLQCLVVISSANVLASNRWEKNFIKYVIFTLLTGMRINLS